MSVITGKELNNFTPDCFTALAITRRFKSPHTN
jgi:hypothetical protein